MQTSQLVGDVNAWRGSSFPALSLLRAATTLPAELCFPTLLHLPWTREQNHKNATHWDVCSWLSREGPALPLGWAPSPQPHRNRSRLLMENQDPTVQVQQPRQGPEMMPSPLGQTSACVCLWDPLCVWCGDSWEHPDSDETAVSYLKIICFSKCFLAGAAGVFLSVLTVSYCWEGKLIPPNCTKRVVMEMGT